MDTNPPLGACVQGLCYPAIGFVGGDPEVARMMGENIRFQAQMTPNRRFVFPRQGRDLFFWHDAHELLRAL